MRETNLSEQGITSFLLEKQTCYSFFFCPTSPTPPPTPPIMEQTQYWPLTSVHISGARVQCPWRYVETMGFNFLKHLVH